MDQQPVYVDESPEGLDKIATKWYRRPVYVQSVSEKFQIVSREELLALVRNWRKLISEKVSASTAK